mmetsp:Transcript_10067/g.11499  ORF Transcript_10067/g.11499 Transcript_10067/m.11499 type:complete len:559 (+) Transcript_10067:76-1752(+)
MVATNETTPFLGGTGTRNSPQRKSIRSMSAGAVVKATGEGRPALTGYGDDDDMAGWGDDDISQFDAIMHLIKGNLGPGVLNLPHAFATAGWVLGFLLASVVAFQGIYSMVLLVYCKEYVRADLKKKRLRQQQEKRRRQNEGRAPEVHDVYADENSICTFMDIAYATNGEAVSIVVQILLFICQGGVCCVFLNLIATNLHALLPSSYDSETCIYLTTGLLLLVVLVRDLKELKWLSMGANVMMVTAIFTASGSAMYVLYQNYQKNNNSDDADFEVEDHEESHYKKFTTQPAVIATFVSSIYYSFEGIGLVMPIENSFVGYKDMHTARVGSTDNDAENGANDNNIHEDDEDEVARKASRSKLFISPVLIGSMCLVAFLFLLIGVTCGPAFPDNVDGSVTAYLSTKYPDSLWYQCVNASVMVAVFLTFPLQLTPAMEVLQEWFGPGCNPCNSFNSDAGSCNASVVKQKGVQKYEWIFRRYLVVLSCSIIVLTVNDLGLLIALFGAVGNTGLAAMPCVFHLKLMQDKRAPYHGVLWSIDVGIIALGVAVAIAGVTFALQEIF